VGTILGTAAYMAPEQAKGKRVDKRCDIWAWGVMLYELLTGERLFEGETTADTLAQVLTKEPDLKRVPAQLRKLLGRCLEKEPKRRLRDIGDAADFLEDRSLTVAAPKAGLSRLAPWAVAGVAIALAAIAFWAPWRSGRLAQEDVVRFTMETAPAEMLGPEEYCCRPTFTSLAVSPDGKTVVFSGVFGSASAQQVQLYKRTMDQSSAVPLASTVGAEQPFFSPNGEWVGFWAGGRLKKIPIAGGPSLVVCEVPLERTRALWGASWSSAGNIVYVANTVSGTDLMEVPESGGTPKPLVKSSPANLYSSPEFLPDGKTVLFTQRTSGWDTAQIVARRLDAGEQRVLFKGADARYVRPGHLVYLQNGVLMAVPFDARRLQLTGPPVAMLDGVMQSINMPGQGGETGMGQFTVSGSGTLVYATGGVAPLYSSTLIRVDRKGVETELNAPKGKDYAGPRFSPDGSRVAAFVVNGIASRDIWMIDATAGTAARLTSQGANTWPIWSPDGKRILFAGGTGGTQVLSLPADGSGAVEPIVSDQARLVPASWPAERLPLIYLTGPDPWEIWSRPTSGAGEPKRFLETRFAAVDADLSPDGRWMAYSSDESGGFEVYVQAFPGPGEKHRISTAGGANPMWARNGRELFYLQPLGSGKHAMMTVDFATSGAFRAGTPHVLFEGAMATTAPLRSYDVSPDGQHFILVRRDKTPDEHVSKLNVVLHWSEELKRRAPPKGQ
jgi:serine/threonine-protein kinase